MRYLLLFVPFVLALAFRNSPATRYFIAWTGSFVILWLSLSGRIKPLPGGLPLRYQLLRPIVFTQIVFAAYTALTSVFYFVLVTGDPSTTRVIGILTPSRTLAAQAQMYYVLAHAAVTTGMLLFASYRTSGAYRIQTSVGTEVFMLRVAVAFFVMMILVAGIPGLSELALRFKQFALAASVCSFALSIIKKHRKLMAINALVFSVNLMNALLSGWKEEVAILLAWFGVLLFPYYRRATIAFAAVALTLFVLVMPAYALLYRGLAWAYQVDPTTAMKIAYRELRSGNIDLKETATGFLVARTSEISLFVGYLDQVPRQRPFYGTQILRQTASMFVPRILWPQKPGLEPLIMERAYENGVISRSSTISAKPQYVVDGYLSAGAVGVLVACLVYGMLASLVSRLAERWFDGYLIGSGLAYSALFQIFWRGNSFEMFFTSVFWSLVVMWGLFVAGRALGLLVPADAVRAVPSTGSTPPLSATIARTA